MTVAPASAVRVQGPARVHITLTDMGFASLRAYGGVGFAVSFPEIEVRAVKAHGAGALRGLKIDDRAAAEVNQLLGRLTHATPHGVDLEILALPPQHSGFGSKTALLLAAATACNELLNLGLSNQDLRLATRRGAASGVGIHTFFGGGVVWDSGHRAVETPSLVPSSANAAHTLPALLGRYRFPSEWRIGLVLGQGAGLQGEDELQFFRTHTPVARSDALETIAIVAHGIIPALVTSNLGDLHSSLVLLHRTGFKKLELERQASETRALLGELQALGYATGMSSLGPLLYVVMPESADDNATIRRLCSQHDSEWVGAFPATNEGRRVSIEQ